MAIKKSTGRLKQPCKSKQKYKTRNLLIKSSRLNGTERREEESFGAVTAVTCEQLTA